MARRCAGEPHGRRAVVRVNERVVGQPEFGAEALHAFDLRARLRQIARVRRRKMAHHARDAQPRQTHHLADRLDLLREESASPHPRVDIEMDIDGPAAPHSSRRQVGRRLLAAHLFLNVELSNRLLHLRFERHSQPEQWNFKPEPANRLRFRIGADAEHVGAGLHGDGSQRLKPVTVSIGLHDDAEFRRSDEPPQILNVVEEVLARHQNLNVMLSHESLLRVARRRRCPGAVKFYHGSQRPDETKQTGTRPPAAAAVQGGLADTQFRARKTTEG